MLPKILSLVSMVLLLLSMFHFLAGGLPLLILKHDDPADSRMVRGFFNVHYLILMSIAAFGALSAALAGRHVLATATACIVLIVFIARSLILMRMDHLRTIIADAGAAAVREFKKLQFTGIALHVFLIVGFISALALASAEIVTCANVPPGCAGEGCRHLCSLL